YVSPIAHPNLCAPPHVPIILFICPIPSPPAALQIKFALPQVKKLPDRAPPYPIQLRLRNSPSLRVRSRTTDPAWIWPQGCSMRQRRTKSGAKFCAALKKAALPRQALVMLVAALVVVVVSAVWVRAAQLASVGIWLVSVPNCPNGPEKSALGFSAETATDMP